MRTIMWLGLASLCAVVLSLAGIYLYLDPQIPNPESYRNVQLETPLRVLSADGVLLAEYGERRLIPTTLDQVPEHFINALLDTEDKRFFQHSGIDFISLANDTVSLVGSLVMDGQPAAGASTITMQLARNVSFSLERRFLRKFKEMLLALKIEQELSKEEILELYINIVPFGKRAYGAQAAAMTYYGKPLDELTLPQLAMLAGIPQRPSANNPINGPEAALRRRNIVLSRMLAQSSISQDQYDYAVAAPMTAQVYHREADVPSPYAAEWVRQQGLGLFPDIYTGGYEIRTTIDSAKQAEAIAAVRRGLINYDHRHGYRGAEELLETELVEELEAEAQAAIEVFGEQTLGTAYPTDLINRVAESLADFATYGEMEAGAVIAVKKKYAIIQRRSGGWIAAHIDDIPWARLYIDVDRRGPPLTKMQEIVDIGDIVRVRALPQQAVADSTAPDETSETGDQLSEQEKAKTNEEEQNTRWALDQLPEIQGALVSLDPDNGAIQAMVGGFDFYRNQYNHALQAARQPGSGFKPFVYSAAIDAGITPAAIYMDAPLVFEDANLESQYRPDNDNKRYNGPTRLREALYKSINLVSIRVLLSVGAGRVLEYVPRFGFSTDNFPRNTQLAIGGGTMAVTPIDMARAYAVLANGGYLVDPYIVESIHNSAGETIYQANPTVVPKKRTDFGDSTDPTDGLASLADVLASGTDPENQQDNEQADDMDNAAENDRSKPAEVDEASNPNIEQTAQDGSGSADITLNEAPRVMDERNAFIMQSMLSDTIKRGTGRRARRLGRDDIAGKTGTTNDAADTWFNGFHKNLVTTVWVGFSNHDPLGSRAYGSNTPLPIWIDYMEEVLPTLPEVQLDQPSGIITLKIDPKTGEPANVNQENALFEYFLREYAPERQTPTNQSATEEVNAIDLF